MAEKSTKNNKNLIIGICAAVVVIVVIIIAVVLATGGGKGGVIGGLNDSYFVSDDTKYVLTLDADDMYIEDTDYAPLKSHLVYTYSGDEVTGLKAYYEYADASAASAAYEFYQANNDGSFKEVALDGKYLILTANEEEYEGLTASDVKQQIEFMQMLNNMDLDEDEESVEIVDEEE